MLFCHISRSLLQKFCANKTTELLPVQILIKKLDSVKTHESQKSRNEKVSHCLSWPFPDKTYLYDSITFFSLTSFFLGQRIRLQSKWTWMSVCYPFAMISSRSEILYSELRCRQKIGLGPTSHHLTLPSHTGLPFGFFKGQIVQSGLFLLLTCLRFNHFFAFYL